MKLYCDMIWWIIGAIAFGALVCLGVLLTVNILRNFRTRRSTKILVADFGTFIRNMPDKEKHSMSFEDLINLKDKQIVCEFDPYTNEVIKTMECDRGMDEQVERAVRNHGGYIILGD